MFAQTNANKCIAFVCALHGTNKCNAQMFVHCICLYQCNAQTNLHWVCASHKPNALQQHNIKLFPPGNQEDSSSLSPSSSSFSACLSSTSFKNKNVFHRFQNRFPINIHFSDISKLILFSDQLLALTSKMPLT